MARPEGALLGSDSVSWRLMGHPAVLLGGPRALLLQISDPLVAAAVRAHSSFEEDPFRRLARTFTVMTDISFGAREKARGAVTNLERRHSQVVGTSSEGVPYSAADPELAMWVHATLVDTLLAVEERYIGELDSAGRARLYDESLLVANALGIPDELVPRDLSAFGDYFSEAVQRLLGDGDAVKVGEDALYLAQQILHPPPARAFGPLAGVASTLSEKVIGAATSELGPPDLCRAFGLERSRATQLLDPAALVSRSVSRYLPTVLLRPSNLLRITGWLASRGPTRGSARDESR